MLSCSVPLSLSCSAFRHLSWLLGTYVDLGFGEDNPSLSLAYPASYLVGFCWDLTLIIMDMMAQRECGGQIMRMPSKAFEKDDSSSKWCMRREGGSAFQQWGQASTTDPRNSKESWGQRCQGSQGHLLKYPHLHFQGPTSFPSRPWFWLVLGIQSLWTSAILTIKSSSCRRWGSL